MVWEAYPVREQIRITELYSLFEVHYEKGYEFPGETHNFWECFYIRKGEACVSGDGRVYNLSAGSIIFHKPLEMHKFVINSREGADLLIFSFAAEGPLTLELAEKVFALSPAQKEILSGLLAFLHERAGRHPMPVWPYPYLEPIHTSAAYAQQLALHLQQLMLSLAEEGAVSRASSAPDALTYQRAISYLNSNIQRQPDLPEIARFCNVSVSGMKRIFEKYAGIGIHKYLIKLKMKAAAELLAGGESVTNVAQKLGFRSQSYFSRAFKRETGLAPSSLKTEKAISC